MMNIDTFRYHIAIIIDYGWHYIAITSSLRRWYWCHYITLSLLPPTAAAFLSHAATPLAIEGWDITPLSLLLLSLMALGYTLSFSLWLAFAIAIALRHNITPSSIFRLRFTLLLTHCYWLRYYHTLPIITIIILRLYHMLILLPRFVYYYADYTITIILLMILLRHCRHAFAARHAADADDAITPPLPLLYYYAITLLLPLYFIIIEPYAIITPLFSCWWWVIAVFFAYYCHCFIIMMLFIDTLRHYDADYYYFFVIFAVHTPLYYFTITLRHAIAFFAIFIRYDIAASCRYWDTTPRQLLHIATLRWCFASYAIDTPWYLRCRLLRYIFTFSLLRYFAITIIDASLSRSSLLRIYAIDILSFLCHWWLLSYAIIDTMPILSPFSLRHYCRHAILLSRCRYAILLRCQMPYDTRYYFRCRYITMPLIIDTPLLPSASPCHADAITPPFHYCDISYFAFDIAAIIVIIIDYCAIIILHAIDVSRCHYAITPYMLRFMITLAFAILPLRHYAIATYCHYAAIIATPFITRLRRVTPRGGCHIFRCLRYAIDIAYAID